MRKYIYIVVLFLVFLSSCKKGEEQNERSDDFTDKYTTEQIELINEGWHFGDPNTSNGDISKEYGITPIIGIQDNYFDILIGNGCDVAVKIIDNKTNKCIRYVFIKENSECNIQQIPQGTYYLKIAYGTQWMSKSSDSFKEGRFTRSVLYEKSLDEFDFGLKNSETEVSYKLSINISSSEFNKIKTKEISEQEFFE